jgi:hypothetical protein
MPDHLAGNYVTRAIEPAPSSATIAAKGVNIIAINILNMGMLNRLFRLGA